MAGPQPPSTAQPLASADLAPTPAGQPAPSLPHPAWQRLLFEQSRDGMLVLDHAGQVLEANPALAAMLGRPLASLPGQPVRALGLPLPAPGESGGPGAELDLVLQRDDGSHLDLAVSVCPVPSDVAPRALVICRDLTPRKQAELALRESERRLGVALAASQIGVWEWDLQADRLHWTAFSALSLGRAAGTSGDDEAGHAQVLAWIHRDDHGAAGAAYRTAMAQGGIFQGEFRVFGYDGQLRWLRVRAVVERGPDGRPQRMLGALLDVTETHRIQQRLSDDAMRRRVLIEQSRDGVVVLNTDGSVDEANQAFADLLGQGLADVQRMHVWDWDDLLSREQLLAILQGPTGPSRITLTRMRHRDGRSIAVEVSATRITLGGRSMHFCVCRDITARVAIEDALRESEARHRATFETSAVGIAENALNGPWLNVNPRLCQITGYPREVLMAMDYRQLTHPDDRADDWPELRAVMRGERTADQREKRYLRADGSTIWVVRTSTAVRGTDGRARYFVTIVEDITARKRAEAELAHHHQQLESEVAHRTQALRTAMLARTESERFLRSIADNLPDMVCYWDAQRVMRFANRPYREWFSPLRDPLGFTRAQLIGDPADDPGERAFADALAGQACRFEHVLTNPAGEVRYTWIHHLPDRRGDAVMGVFVLVSDISEIKQAELRLQALNEQLVAARDRSEAANRAKSAFLANISHEIRTPMNAIIGLTHLMQRDASDGAGAERLGKVSDAAHHLLDVINDVLDLSKIESGKLRLESTDFPIDAVLTRACALVADRARAKGLELVLKSDGVPHLLRGDPTRLSQALLNLMSNAVKFTDRGSIVLRCELMSANAERLQLRFSVRDTGVGVPADKVGELFNPFEQADTSTTRRFGGTGLGLAITRRLALLMNGDVGVHSLPGQGSCFWFTASFQRAAQAAAGDTGLRLPGRRALVADDHPEARAALAELLRRLGLQVDTVDSGDAAEQAVLRAQQRRLPYELVLLDAGMPAIDGLAALRRLRALLGEGAAPCILLTQSDHSLPLATAVEAGALAVLDKPITLSALTDCIARLDTAPWQRPLADRRTAQPHEQALRERPAGARVLLAEDNPINQEVASELLAAVGLQVDLAADGQEAVRLAASHDYDLVLMDMQMPVVDGLAATRQLRAMPQHARTPILAMTANAFGDDRQACLAAGMDDHLAKPVDPELLYAMLGRWLPARRVPAPAGRHTAQGVPAASAPATMPVPPPALVPEPLPPVEVRPPEHVPTQAPAPVPAPAPPAGTGSPDFSGIPGLAMSRALLYLPGRDQVYARVLRQFADNYSAGVPGLVDALRGGRWAEARQALHSLRGACGAVGATEVMAQALELEQVLRARGDAEPGDATIDQALTALSQTLDDLVGRVRLRLADPASPGTAATLRAADLARLSEGLAGLSQLLESADFQAGQVFRQLEAALRTALGPDASQRLAHPLRQHDYEAAHLVLQGLRQALPGALAAAQAAEAARPPPLAQP